MIVCNSDCVFQQEGCCALDRAAACGRPGSREKCIYYLPRTGGVTAAPPGPPGYCAPE